MGLFLTMLACKVSSRDDIIEALVDVMKHKGFSILSKEKVSQITGQDNQFDVTESKNEWIQVFCPETPDDSVPEQLSKKLNIPIFQFHIHDGNFWIYQLFVSGELKDRHNPIPDYWGKVSKEEKSSWKGNPDVLVSIFGVKKSKIEPYLSFWEKIKDDNTKAFPKDKYSIRSEWAMTDFQQKFGIEYPDFEKFKEVELIRLTFKRSKLSNLGK